MSEREAEIENVQNPSEEQPPRWTVAAYIMRDDRVLLVKHNRLGLWLPVGGGIEPGERPYEALVREVKEETGLIIERAHVLGYDEHDGGGRVHMNLSYRVSVYGHHMPVSDGSWERHQWVRIGDDNFPAPMPPNVIRTLMLLTHTHHRRNPSEVGRDQAPAPWNTPRRFWCDECGSAWGVDRAVEAARAEGHDVARVDTRIARLLAAGHEIVRAMERRNMGGYVVPENLIANLRRALA